VIYTPRRKPEKVIEYRISLSDFERRMADDASTISAAKVVGDTVAGIAQGLGGLGIGVGILAAGLLWNKDLKDLTKDLMAIWPESGQFMSPEWVAKWGDDPIPETEDEATKKDNEFVDSLSVAGLQGKSPYEVYSITASGRQASYDWEKANAVQNHANKYGIGIQPGSIEATQILATWISLNPPPPQFLLLNQFAFQINIRETAQRRVMATTVPLIGLFGLLQERDPTKFAGYDYDDLLDWAAMATYPHKIWIPKVRDNFNDGIALIEKFAFWAIPIP
jgi:hypothetical protein